MFNIATVPKPAGQGLSQDGLSLLTPGELLSTLQLPTPAWTQDWAALAQTWNNLPPDAHLKDGGHYRKRRHACYVQDMATGALVQTPHRAHWQPTDYNALHGGFERWFDPVEPSVAAAPAWTQLISAFGGLFAGVQAVPEWYVEAHQFRIDTVGGVGRPTPEGAHRDGVNFVVVLLVSRHGVKGGETRVFDANGPHGVRFLMQEPLTALLLDDARVIHETTPILPADEGSPDGYRDTLVLTYRAGGFQAP
ncbi:MAG: 2OG-Fe dioxygenase family protein [Polaromonas sp.]|uniref:2OG-Fe dioxygenase family protein n=1 Tax=Polaromonas sp. TaxID=1869339 RepID=UPI0025F4D7D6|nr:2OG-Fe dioxygenase family protein [Polaromonas sp.]MBI2728262.1 2OG-Fe dioxygenase family protein [Polaromonas sp.]